MNSVSRILLELFGPSLLGGIQAMVIGIAGSQKTFGPGDIIQGAIAFTLFALVICGIQSVCYTVLMEVAFRRGLRRRSLHSIAFSTFLGVLSGASFMFYSDSSFNVSSILFFCTVGAIVGLTIASIIYYFEPREEEAKTA
jgi:hypothetical protein